MKEIIELISKLIEFKSETNNNSEIYKCFSFIKDYFKGTDYNCEINSFNDHFNLYVGKNETYYDVIFSGHIDVVPAQNEQYKATISEGYLFGRGSIDMKSQVAVMMHVLKNYKGNKKICMLLTSDEEIGGFSGTPLLIDKYGIHGNVAIVPDGGNNFQLINSERGVLQLNIDIKGKSVHSSCAYEGTNAIEKATELYHKIRDIVDAVSRDDQTVNLAKISTTNEVYNKVPDDANMLIDIRYNIKSPIDKVFAMLDNEPNIQYAIYAQADPFYTDESNEYVKKYLAICTKILGKEIDIIGCPAASDARFFSAKGIPVIMMNPNGNDMHGANEKIEIDSICKLIQIYNDFLDT